jgi:hypothetical protein
MKNTLNINHNFKLKPIGLNQAYVTGFTDGEGCFVVSIQENSRYRTG